MTWKCIHEWEGRQSGKQAGRQTTALLAVSPRSEQSSGSCGRSTAGEIVCLSTIKVLAWLKWQTFHRAIIQSSLSFEYVFTVVTIRLVRICILLTRVFQDEQFWIFFGEVISMRFCEKRSVVDRKGWNFICAAHLIMNTGTHTHTYTEKIHFVTF